MNPSDALKAVKPKLRGVIHEIAFFVSLVTGPILVLLASAARTGAAVFSIALSALFGVSALYHRPNWKPEIRRWLRRLDHSMIFVLIAGTFTPLALILDTRLANVLLIIVWLAVLLGLVIQLIPISMPRPLIVIPYLALGWLGLSIMPQVVDKAGIAVPVLLLTGGVLYTLGAIVYARRSPDPKPEVFGYHEIFHAFVVAAAYLHYTAIALALG